MALLAAVLSGCLTTRDDGVDYARLQSKFEAAPPMSFTELVQAFQKKQGMWPNSREDIITFETATYGKSAIIDWTRFGKLQFHPQEDSSLVIVSEHQEDGLTITGCQTVDPATHVDVRGYFSRWRTATPDQRYRVKSIEVMHKVLSGESERTALALLGKPDRDGIAVPSDYTGWWQDEMGKLMLYRVTRSEWHDAATLRVWVKKDGTIFSVDDGGSEQEEPQQGAAPLPSAPRTGPSESAR